MMSWLVQGGLAGALPPRWLPHNHVSPRAHRDVATECHLPPPMTNSSFTIRHPPPLATHKHLEKSLPRASH